MSVHVVDGRKIANKIEKDVAKKVKFLEEKHGFKPNVATIKIGGNKESDLYLDLRDKACGRVGIESTHVEFSSDVSEKKVLKKISALNSNKGVHGVLIQMPLPDHVSRGKLFEFLDPKKDVEGFTPSNMGRLLVGDEFVVPCTPLAVLRILEHEEIDLKGKDVVVVNHSVVVGKPLAALFLNRDASVSVVHVFTEDIERYTREADVLVSATGVSSLIKKDYVKPGAFVLDVGIIKTDSGVTGDVDFDSVSGVAGKITPVPGGVGPVTVACSLSNMVKTFNEVVEDNSG